MFARLGGQIRRGVSVIFKTSAFYVIPAACTLHTVFSYVGEITPSVGASMLPTLNMEGDALAVWRFGNWRKNIQPGDLVIFISPNDPHRRAVKRVLGLGGDTICIDPTKKEKLEYLQIPNGYLWLQGDNHSNSTDSRTYGPIPMSLVSGKVVARAWPWPCLINNGMEIVPGRFSSAS
ncbi:hypothetical protein FB645_005178 [Coemansia sp. IMI 203386]|nr:hypothetical protein FB645_005178 [Coemansia sp. IMI 203386]